MLSFFSLQNAVCFIMLTCLVPVLFTFYIQAALKLKNNNSGAKGLRSLKRTTHHCEQGCVHCALLQILSTKEGSKN